MGHREASIKPQEFGMKHIQPQKKRKLVAGITYKGFYVQIYVLFLPWPHPHPIVSGPLLDGRVLWRQLQNVLPHHSILHYGHYPPWLWISSAITLGVLRTPSVLAGKQSTKVKQHFAYGLFLLYPALCRQL